ncbi:hypothetical protein FGG78_22305 [Thioclava sp. BHET1]|nr:hypothetical protein FGG78_22305 [Thioclava sp. BHET1]
MNIGTSIWDDDANCLRALDMADLGFTKSGIAAEMGVSRNSVIGILHRIEKATDQAERGSTAQRPENCDGGMPNRWWMVGLDAQQGVDHV